MIITEGYMPFLGYHTYYRVVGSIEESLARGLAPLVCLHGGPGSTHDYMELLDPLAKSGRALVMYDQLGCGRSPVTGHPELWVAKTWVEELAALREHLHLTSVHLLGQSWGGMLAITYLCDCSTRGVRSVILSSTLSDSQLWGREQHRQIGLMDQADQAAIREAEATGDYHSEAFLTAVAHFMTRHCAGQYGPDSPECLTRPRQTGRESYEVAWGPNEFTPLGTLKDWCYTERLRDIRVPALIVSGTNDLCTPLIAKTMADRIPDSRWELFEGCRHMCFAEDTPRYLAMTERWLRGHDLAQAKEAR